MKEVFIYTTPSCVYCRMTKNFFQKNSVQYQEFNVATDLKAREDMVKKSGQLGVPVVEISGKIVVGYDEPRLKELLEIK